jgi:predicted HTH transcriptional regulator
LLKDHSGETEFLDFKEEWPRYSALAKHILAFANTGNGCIVVGIAETEEGGLEPVGLSALTDKAKIIDGIKGYLPTELLARVDVLDFHFEASEYPTLIGKKFQVMFVEFSSEHIPFVSLREGDGIKAPAIYVRRAGQTAEATHDEVQKVINKRIETRYSTSDEITLKQHLEQLRVLYSERPYRNPFASVLRLFTAGARTDDEDDEMGYGEFVKRAIAIKKALILESIGATPDMIEAESILNRISKKPVVAKLAR